MKNLINRNWISDFGLVCVVTLGAGCASIPSNAPQEFHQAEASIKAAERADADDVLPAAMQEARLLYRNALTSLDRADDELRKGRTEEGTIARRKAVDEAKEAHFIAANALRVRRNLTDWDRNINGYVHLAEEADSAASASAMIARLQTENETLRGEVARAAERPAVERERIPADFKVAKPVAYFASNSTKIASSSRTDIDQLAELLRKNEDFKVTLSGYADKRGSASLNEELALKRAEAVKDVLERRGIASSRIEVVSLGASASDAGSPGGMQLDRKVVADISTVAH